MFNYFTSDIAIGVRVKGIFSVDETAHRNMNNVVYDKLENYKQFVLENSIDEIYYTMPLTYTKKIKNIIDFCDKNLIRFRIIPDFRGFLFKKVNIDFLNDVPVITLRDEPLTDFINKFLKRLFDIIFSAIDNVYLKLVIPNISINHC